MPNVYRKYDTKTGVWADFGDLKARNDIGIVEDTDTATHTINDGQYVIWKGNLYTANSAITIDTVLSTSNLTAVNNGGLNDLNTNINSSLSAIDSSLAIVANGDTHIAITSGQYVYVKNHSTLSEGLYTANSAIGVNVALTTSNLTGVTIGGFNNILNKIDNRIVRAGTVQSVLDTDAAIKHAFIPNVSGYTLEGCTFVVAHDGFISNNYSMFGQGGTIYIRDPAQTFTSSTQFTFMYVAVYRRN